MHNTRAVGSMCEVELILLIGNDVGQNLGMNSCLPSASVSSVLMVIRVHQTSIAKNKVSDLMLSMFSLCSFRY